MPPGRWSPPRVSHHRRRTRAAGGGGRLRGRHLGQPVRLRRRRRTPTAAAPSHAHVMSGEHDTTFHSMGSDVRLLIGPPLLRDGCPPTAAAAARARVRRGLRGAAVALSRGQRAERAQPRSPRREVPASPVAARRGARRRLGGAAQRRAGRSRRSPARWSAIGYASSLDGQRPAPLREALAAAPAAPAGARASGAALASGSSWTIAAASCVARQASRSTRAGPARACAPTPSRTALLGYTRFVVDCGGDLAIGGVGAQLEPYEVEIEHPLTGETIRTVRVSAPAAWRPRA